MQKKSYLWQLIVLGLVVVISSLFYYMFSLLDKSSVTQNTNKRQILIGFSMGTLQEERWRNDRDEFLKKAEELGVSVDLQTANNSTDKQISQIESMIIKKVDILVIAPNDAASLSEVVAEAQKAGIEVISYDRLITNSDINLYISFDNEIIGNYEAQSILDFLKNDLDKGNKIKLAYIGGAENDNNSVLLKKGSFEILQPYIDNKKIEIVLDKFTPGWSPDTAYQNLKLYLKNTNGDINGVICANDGTAFGAIRALEEYNLAGKVPVSGQDAELAAIIRIINGTQISTVYKPVNQLADIAVKSAIDLIDNKLISTNAKTNNGVMDVPTILLDPINVTKENIDQTVIKDGYHKFEEIYKQ